MKPVLFAAVASLFLALAAHAADAPQPREARDATAHALVSHNLAPASVTGATCIGGATITPTAYSTDADAESDTAPCSQFLSTQTLVQEPTTGRT